MLYFIYELSDDTIFSIGKSTTRQHCSIGISIVHDPNFGSIFLKGRSLNFFLQFFVKQLIINRQINSTAQPAGKKHCIGYFKAVYSFVTRSNKRNTCQNGFNEIFDNTVMILFFSFYSDFTLPTFRFTETILIFAVEFTL